MSSRASKRRRRDGAVALWRPLAWPAARAECLQLTPTERAWCATAVDYLWRETFLPILDRMLLGQVPVNIAVAQRKELLRDAHVLLHLHVALTGNDSPEVLAAFEKLGRSARDQADA